MTTQPLMTTHPNAAQSEHAISCDDVTVEYQMMTHRYSGLKDLVLHPRQYLASKRRFCALNGVTVKVPRGQSIGLIGHNGCGKSTLLKAIAGVITPQKGQVSVRGRIGPMIELGAGFDHELSGLENIELSCMLMGLSRQEIRERQAAIIQFADLGEFIHAPLKNYSSGMTARIGFACATAIDPQVLLVDEVLSVGDTNFAQKCLKRINELRMKGTTVVLVSHDMAAVRTFCDRVVVLEEGNLRYDGDVIEGVRFHLDLMHQRMNQGLTAQARAEADRQHALRVSAVIGDGPRATVKAAVIQDGREVTELDAARAFELTLDVQISKLKDIRPGLAFGVAISVNGSILAGFNNLDLRYPDPAMTVKGMSNDQSHFKVVYRLDHGMPELVSHPEIDLFVGVHDDQISREIFMGRVLQVAITNSLYGPNRHGYLANLQQRVSAFELHS